MVLTLIFYLLIVHNIDACAFGGKTVHNSSVEDKTITDTALKINEKESQNEIFDNVFKPAVEDDFSEYPEISYQEIYQSTTKPLQYNNSESGIIDDGFQYVGYAYEAVRICQRKSPYLTVERLIGTAMEKYFNASFDSRTFRNLKHADLVVTLTVPVEVFSISNAIVSKINDTTYAISGPDVNKSVYFRVQALPGEGFPFLKHLLLNGKEICKNKRNWKPSLLGVQDQAVISPLLSPHLSGEYYCGRSKVDYEPLVVKGQPTREGDYPWHVAIFIRDAATERWGYACGGSIISGKTILTAGHCAVNKKGETLKVSEILVVAAKHRLSVVDTNQYPIMLKEIKVHPNYSNSHSRIVHDLALLIAEDYINYGLYVQPVCMWNRLQDHKEVIYQEYGVLPGWGVTENDTLSDVLLAGSLQVVPDSTCFRSRPTFFSRYLTENTFCTGNKNGTSACNGDSGGGIVFPILEEDMKISWYLRGMVSVGVRRAGGLCDPHHYVVFTDLARYRDWIEENQQL